MPTAIIVIIVILLIIHVIIKQKEQEHENENATPTPHLAKLIKIDGHLPTGGFGGNITIAIKINHREVVFRLLSSNKKMRFDVDMDEFYRLEKLPLGTEGTLTVQGTRYISFQQNKEESLQK